MINTQINELVAYGLKCGLVSEDDQIFVTNQLLDLFRLSEFHEEEILKSRPLAEILEDMVSYAHQQGILEEDTIAWKDLFEITEDNIHAILQKEIGKVFVQVLECAGVYKNTKKGRIDFGRFIETL